MADIRRPTLAPTLEPSFSRPRGPEQPVTERIALWWRHRKFLGHVLWMSALLSTVVAFLIPKRYDSTARLVVPDNQSSSNFANMLNKASGGTGSLLGLDPSSLLGLKTPGAFYVALLQSRTVQEHLVDRFDLRAHYHKKYAEDARKRLNENTTIAEDKKSGVITLSVNDWHADFAAMLARSYIDELNRIATGLNVSAAHLEREFLEERLKTAKQDLDRASIELSRFSSEHAVADFEQQGKTMMDAAARLQGELIASQAELRGLEQIYSDDNVRVRTLRARVSELQSQLKKLVGNYTPPNQPLSEQPGGTYPAVRALPALGYRYQDLYRDAKIQQTVFEFLTEQYEMARVEEARELPVLRMMDEPDVPEKKASPTRSLIIGLSIGLALVLACWWLVLRERWEQLSPEDSRRLLMAEVKSDLRAGMRRLRRSRAKLYH